jgi:hypothetical protein
MARERRDLLRHVPRHFEAEPKEFIQLPTEDDDRDAARESRHDRIGKELEQATHAERAENDQHHARHHRGEGEPAVSVNRDYGKQDGHECARRSRHLKPRAAEECDDKACDDSGPESLLRCDA